jgi:endoglucanase
MIRINHVAFVSGLLGIFVSFSQIGYPQEQLTLNKQDYFEMPGLNVFVFTDNYAEGHQGGIQIIQHGNRIASNGDIWLEPAPGQWSPFSQINDKNIDPADQSITISLGFPNKQAAERKFNPILYPNLELTYKVVVKAEGSAFRIIVNLDKPLPKEWIGKVGFNLELYPGDLFGKAFFMDGKAGSFPLQLNGPFYTSPDKGFEVVPMAEGKELIIAPESEKQMLKIQSAKNAIQLIDGRSHHTNGWFIVRSLIPKGASNNAIEWLITPNIIPNWKYLPVIHINQVGYLVNQPKLALIECDKKDSLTNQPKLFRILPSGERQLVYTDKAKAWGIYQRYNYFQFDFTSVTEAGVYSITYDTVNSEYFRIGNDIYDRDVWQPLLEYFLPVQMCHMRVNDRYRVWHGLCHMDDASMAPVDYVHFDGYVQGPSTLTSYQPGEHVPGLNQGGWHDAGDFDLRTESQAGTIYTLSLIYEAFGIGYDITTIDQQKHLVEMHQPDGKPDILQQIEHGALSITGGYSSLGGLYRGIISNDLRQYVTLGDPTTMTNNIVYEPAGVPQLPAWIENSNDDRWVFTENNSQHTMQVCMALAAAARILKDTNDSLAMRCLTIAEELWAAETDAEISPYRIEALVELILTTGKQNYFDQLIAWSDKVTAQIKEVGWEVSRVLNRIEDSRFHRGYMLAMQQYYIKLQQETMDNPFGVPYKPATWGLAWSVERFGIAQYYLYKNLQNDESKKYLINSLNYVLGIHAGENTTSFVSGVGSKSATVAYGLNRDDWSYIPGGVISGTATIKPDLPELKEWPYLWQQSEYMISGAAENFMFLVLAAKELMK